MKKLIIGVLIWGTLNSEIKASGGGVSGEAILGVFVGIPVFYALVNAGTSAVPKLVIKENENYSYGRTFGYGTIGMLGGIVGGAVVNEFSGAFIGSFVGMVTGNVIGYQSSKTEIEVIPKVDLSTNTMGVEFLISI